MQIQVTCPQGHKLKAPTTHAGKQAKCPTCGAVVLVPRLGTTQPSKSLEQPSLAHANRPPSGTVRYSTVSLADNTSHQAVRGPTSPSNANYSEGLAKELKELVGVYDEVDRRGIVAFHDDIDGLNAKATRLLSEVKSSPHPDLIRLAVQLLRCRYSSIGDSARAGLAAIGEPAVPFLLDRLAESWGSRVADVLAEIGSTAALHPLIQVGLRKPYVVPAIILCGKNGSQAATAFLIKVLERFRPRWFLLCSWAFVRAGDRTAFNYVEALAQHRLQIRLRWFHFGSRAPWGSEKIPLEKLKDFARHILDLGPDVVPRWVVFELARRTLGEITGKNFATAKEWLAWSREGR